MYLQIAKAKIYTIYRCFNEIPSGYFFYPFLLKPWYCYHRKDYRYLTRRSRMPCVQATRRSYLILGNNDSSWGSSRIVTSDKIDDAIYNLRQNGCISPIYLLLVPANYPPYRIYDKVMDDFYAYTGKKFATDHDRLKNCIQFLVSKRSYYLIATYTLWFRHI